MLLVTLSVITIIILNDNKQEIKLDNVSLNEVTETNGFALMLEQEDGTYEETTDTEWPSDMYFNEVLSGCIDNNGNTLNNVLTYRKGSIKLKTRTNSMCYLYFDMHPSNLTELCQNYNNINDCVQNETDNISYINDIWDSPLEDDGYRYVGTNPDNYICFGTTDQEECMNNIAKYMYRIIGIFEDKDGGQHLKLIKQYHLNKTYAWQSVLAEDLAWDESDLYKGINGSYFLTNTTYSYMQDSAWNNLITTWDYIATDTKRYLDKGPYYYAQNIRTTYLHEMNRNDKVNQICYNSASVSTDCSIGDWKTVSAKIGLMYVSDYQLSLGSVTLDYTNNNSTHYTSMKTGWMHITNNDLRTYRTSSYDWTMTRVGKTPGGNSNAYLIYLNGYVNLEVANAAYGIRPVFYLTSNTLLRGEGAATNPYVITNL